MRKSLAVLAACLLTAAMFAGCGPADRPDVENPPAGQTEPNSVPEDTRGNAGSDTTEPTRIPDETEPTQTQDETEPTEIPEETEPTEIPEETVYGGVTVRTKFGNLYYQDQWSDFMRVAQIETDSGLVVLFQAEFDDVYYPLFRLIIGSGEGDPVGQLTDANGVARDVFVIMEEIDDLSELTEGEQNRLFAMQEDINFIIENLK